MAGRRRARKAALAAAVLCALTSSPAQAGLILIANLTDGGVLQANPMVSQAIIARNCVDSSSGKYRVTATGSGPGGAFELSAGAGLALPYGLEWSDSGAASTGQALTSGVPLTGQTTPFLTSCLLGSISSTLVVRLASNDLQAAVAGLTYAGVVTLLVAPE